jgi:general secretion pathway protein J
VAERAAAAICLPLDYSAGAAAVIRASGCRSQGGFTLLELLIAITLLGVLTIMLLSGFQLGTRHLERQAARIDRSTQIPAVHGFLRTQLADAQPILEQMSGNRSIVFDGRPAGLEFVGVAPQSLTTGGLQLFSVERDPRVESRLRVRWQLFGVPEVGMGQGAHEALLLDGVARLAFHYYGAIQPGTPSAWHEAWQDMEYLPLLIRLELVFQDGERMPELIVAIRLSAAPRAQ